MIRIKPFIALAAVAAVALSGAQAQSGSAARIEQINSAGGNVHIDTPPQAGNTTIAIQPIRATASSNVARQPTASELGRPDAPAAPSPELVKACRAAEAGGPAPKGVDCRAIAQMAAEAANTPTPESVMLGLLGMSGSVTQPGDLQQTNPSDADSLARQFSNGAQDSLTGDAAGIAARQRPSPR